MIFGHAVDAAIMRHAVEAYPAESCGIVVNGAYVALANSHSQPDQGFDCGALVADFMVQGAMVQGLAHSHPYSLRTGQEAPHTLEDPKNPPWPTAEDMRGQSDMAVPWAIVPTDGVEAMPPIWWGPGVPMPPLEGRDYRWGPSGSDGKGDCLALILDWYEARMGIRLPDFPRDDGWWARDENLYEDNVAPFGFKELSEGADLKYGDVFLMQAASKVLNHGGVFVGDGQILHHPANKLSKYVPAVVICRQHAVRWFRHG